MNAWSRTLPNKNGMYLINIPIFGYALINVWRDWKTVPHCQAQEPEPVGSWMADLVVPNPPRPEIMPDTRYLSSYSGCQFLGPLPKPKYA